MTKEKWPSFEEIEAAVQQHNNTDNKTDIDALRDFLLYDALPRLLEIVYDQRAQIERQRKKLRKKGRDAHTKVNANAELTKKVNEALKDGL